MPIIPQLTSQRFPTDSLVFDKQNNVWTSKLGTSEQLPSPIPMSTFTRNKTIQNQMVIYFKPHPNSKGICVFKEQFNIEQKENNKKEEAPNY